MLSSKVILARASCAGIHFTVECRQNLLVGKKGRNENSPMEWPGSSIDIGFANTGKSCTAGSQEAG
jgi:hypothetical protein